MARLRKSDTKNRTLYTSPKLRRFSFEWPQFGTMLKRVYS
jgi:hypothetical protein